ncbi:hypothetical protein BSKO_03229 [Bryopsis sp. KO-2023]|nr:hypothetical protein BSKO_03229 [Bryopsis sp. KO-2023]
MVHKALAAFAFLAVTFSVATPAMGVKSTRSLLCPSCTDACSTCVCGKCVKCGWGHHSSGFWSKDCVPHCESCYDDYCAGCGCDGYCNACQDGYEFGEDGYCCEIWHVPAHPKPSEKVHYEEPAPKPSKKVHYKEPVHYEEPAPKPV